MFRRISNIIALRFTAFVFLLLLINGALFLAADIGNARREMQGRLNKTAHAILDFARFGSMNFPQFLPPPMRERVRVLSADGAVQYSGGVLQDVPVALSQGYSESVVDGDRYSVLTLPIVADGNIQGFLQIAEVQRVPMTGLPIRVILYLLVSVAISALTFAVGQFFARTSLRPAEAAMQRLEQFTQDASHELRTPLAALNSSLDLALRTKQYEQGIVSAKEDLAEVSSLVERLLELARLDKLVLEPTTVDAAGLLQIVADKYRDIAKKKSVSLVVEGRQDVQLKADAALLRQLASNLIVNAVKFSKPEGGTVTIRLEKDSLTIADQGIGIEPKDLEHIFDRFYQAEASRSNDGFGLGLALVQRIVDLHGWNISVTSSPGIGTTFTVRFSPSAKRRNS